MQRQKEAVFQILNQISQQGMDWYRGAKLEQSDLLRSRSSEKYELIDTSELWNIGSQPSGSFSSKKFLVLEPHTHDKEPFLGIWLRWDFTGERPEFSLFLGFWSIVNDEKSFVAFRFEAPEIGSEHDYYHCQPCRNFGDKEDLPEAVAISDRFPTIPLNAGNIVELTVCALMSTLGREKAKAFMLSLLKDSEAGSNEYLVGAYNRCCKSSYVEMAA